MYIYINIYLYICIFVYKPTCFNMSLWYDDGPRQASLTFFSLNVLCLLLMAEVRLGEWLGDLFAEASRSIFNRLKHLFCFFVMWACLSI